MNFIKKITNQGNMALTILLVAGIIVVVNFISYQLFFRLDLTENNDYSISKVSKKTVASLEDVVNIKLYFSKDLPANFLNLEREVRDILTEYKNYSNGNVELSFIDPASLDDPVNELAKIGIPALQFNVVENDSMKWINGFMAMSIQYEDKQEVIPMLDSGRNLEYKITSIIKKMVIDSKKTIGLVVSHGTVDMDVLAKQASGALADLYQVVEIDMENNDVDLSNIDTLVLVGPESIFLEEQLKKLDQFVMSGKPLLVLADGMKMNDSAQVTVNETGLNALLNKYGLNLNNNLIADVSGGRASIPNGFFNLVVDYGFWPKVIKDNFSKDNVIVASLENLILPWASDIEILSNGIGDGVSATVLAASTDKACAYSENINIDPRVTSTDCSNRGKYNFAVSLVGPLHSAFTEKTSTESRLIVVADSNFVTDQFLAEDSDNLTFFQNLVDGLTLDADLINIRSAGVTDRPIKMISETTKGVVRYLNIFGVTVLVVALGMLRYFLRRRNKFSDEI